MKKSIIGVIMAAGLLLLVSCKPDDAAGTINNPENVYTPTPIVVPTCTPTASPAPDTTQVPTATEAVEPTKELQPSPTATPEPTVTLVPSPEEVTATPTPSPTPAVTLAPSPEPTAMPTATPSPEPTATPTATPSPEPTPTPSPTPAIDPEPLVSNGWQKTISIDEEYLIIFPDLFRESTVTKTDQVLQVGYTCAEDSEIEFRISYTMQQTLEEAVKEIPEREGVILEGSLEEKRMLCRWQTDGTIYRSILLEAQYPKTLLGTNFGEEEWITGVMQVILSYPADRYEEYESTEYSYYVIENREE